MPMNLVGSLILVIKSKALRKNNAVHYLKGKRLRMPSFPFNTFSLIIYTMVLYLMPHQTHTISFFLRFTKQFYFLLLIIYVYVMRIENTQFTFKVRIQIFFIS